MKDEKQKIILNSGKNYNSLLDYFEYEKSVKRIRFIRNLSYLGFILMYVLSLIFCKDIREIAIVISLLATVVFLMMYIDYYKEVERLEK